MEKEKIQSISEANKQNQEKAIATRIHDLLLMLALKEEIIMQQNLKMGNMQMELIRMGTAIEQINQKNREMEDQVKRRDEALEEKVKLIAELNTQLNHEIP